MAPLPDTIAAETAFRELALTPSARAWIDVRAEGEFRQGSLPGFTSAPLLRDAERHEVGLRYKQQGQASAIELGHTLVDPHRAERVAHWVEIARVGAAAAPVVCCWRGGLRSQISTEWMREAGCQSLRIVGGYKALRHLCLAQLEHPTRLLVLSGATGSGKTDLLTEIPTAKIDLEALAHHRGSAFGGRPDTPQPSQATFENALALELARRQEAEVLIEDESSTIGTVKIPEPVFERMARAPVVRLELPREERARRVGREYVEEPLRRGTPPAALEARLQSSLKRIVRRLGGAAYADISADLRRAFETSDPEAHTTWVTKLLRLYYDPLYEYSFARVNRPVLFRGSREECRAWIRDRYVSPKP